MADNVPRVFVSYAHESGSHKEQVLALATFLRAAGVDAVLDQWSDDVRRDWYSWAIHEMTAADFVLVVASARYRASGDGAGPVDRNRGVQSEAALLRELVHADRATWLPKILPVLLPGHDVDEIPLFLQPYSASRYPVTSFDTAGAESLLRTIFRQPGQVPPDVADERPELPPHPAPPSRPRDHSRVVNQINGTVTGKVIQADVINGDIHFH
ncbi:MAG: TIR domain-containing protein [Actinomycetota bacterium]|nr:TIR domain-containing protein [Actinomycetota bacterium]